MCISTIICLHTFIAYIAIKIFTFTSFIEFTLRANKIFKSLLQNICIILRYKK